MTSGQTPVPGALVQLCVVNGSCTQIQTDNRGQYRFPVGYGSFALTVYPPVNGLGSNTSVATASASTSAQAPYAQVDIALQTPSLPPGASLTSPSFGTVTSGQPTIFWEEPTVYKTTGCPNGWGFLLISGTDTTTGQPASRFVPLTETPPGSGHYQADIPALAPLHGTGRFDPLINCSAGLSFFPQGGPQAGGTSVLIRVSSPTVTGVHFGSSAGVSFTQLSPDLYQVTSPAGTGDVPLTVTFTDGSTSRLGTFHYLSASLSGPAEGSADGGGVIDIHGQGFAPGTHVLIGGRPSPSVQVVNSGELLVVAPPGEGTGTVTVMSQGGSTVAGSYTYDGTPSAEALYENDLEAADFGLLLTDVLSEESPESAALDISLYLLEKMFDDSLPEDDKPFIGVIGITIAWSSGAGEGALLVEAVILLMETLPKFVALIDPSGAVVDSNGAPVPGASVTLFRQNGGSLTPVPSGDQTIDPSVNPQTTGPAGTFAWEATAGIYQVTASSPSCVDGSGTPITVKTPIFGIPPPVTGLVLTLPCSIGTAAPPKISAISPAIVPSTGGQTVTVTGTGFDHVSQVLIGTKPAPRWTVLSPTSLQVVTAARTGTADIRVVTPSGTSNVSATDKVSFATPPTAAVSPDVGRGAVNHPVTFTGANLSGITTLTSPTPGVTFSTVHASGTKVTAKVSVTAKVPLGPLSVSMAKAIGPAIACTDCLSVTAPPALNASAQPIQVSHGGSVTADLPLRLEPGGQIVVSGQPGITISILNNSGTVVIASVTVSSTVTPGQYNATFINPDGGRTTAKSIIHVT